MVSTRRKAALNAATDSDDDAPEEVSLQTGKAQAQQLKDAEKSAKKTASAAKRRQPQQRQESKEEEPEQQPKEQEAEDADEQEDSQAGFSGRQGQQVANEQKPGHLRFEEDLLPESVIAAIAQKQPTQDVTQLAAQPGGPKGISKRKLKKQKLLDAKRGVVAVKVLGKRLEAAAQHKNFITETLAARKRSHDMLTTARHRPAVKF